MPKVKPTPIPVRFTERGFGIGEFTDAYGYDCSIQESSVVPHLWLGVNQDQSNQYLALARTGPIFNVGWKKFDIPLDMQIQTRMHLSQEQAAALIPLLQHFVKRGTLPPGQSCERNP